MKRLVNFLVSGMIVLGVQSAVAQKTDDSRMNRDIVVAEGVLSTLIKQEFTKRTFFPVEVKGNYREGYGVTFTVPTNMMSFIWTGNGNRDVVVLDGAPGAYAYSIHTEPDEEIVEGQAAREKEIAAKKSEKDAIKKETARVKEERAAAEAESHRIKGTGAITRVRQSRNEVQRDSLIAVGNEKVIAAAKNFLADYGDMLSQLKPGERIIITNRGENSNWFFRQDEKRSIILIEATKDDLTQFRQGKISRDQLMSKIKVTNTESSGKVEPDLELLASIFNRLYRSDLSTTFFAEGNIYYERLNDYGAIVYMQVYSSHQADDGLYNMPTVDLREVDQAARDKKVKEIYPVFENELKENILDYGRTLKSLRNNEQLVFNVKITKCKGCGIPADVEVSVPNSVLQDYGTGKMDKASALAKMTVKKGAGQ